MRIALLFDFEIALYRKVDDRSRHYFIVVVHLSNVAQRGRRESLRRIVARNNDAFIRILAMFSPDGNIVGEQQGQSEQRDREIAIIVQEPR